MMTIAQFSRHEAKINRDLDKWDAAGVWEAIRTPHASSLDRLIVGLDSIDDSLWSVYAERDGMFIVIATARTKDAAGAWCRVNYPDVRRRYDELIGWYNIVERGE